MVWGPPAPPCLLVLSSSVVQPRAVTFGKLPARLAVEQTQVSESNSPVLARRDTAILNDYPGFFSRFTVTSSQFLASIPVGVSSVLSTLMNSYIVMCTEDTSLKGVLNGLQLINAENALPNLDLHVSPWERNCISNES